MNQVIVGLREIWPLQELKRSPVYLMEYILGDWTKLFNDDEVRSLQLPPATTLALSTLGMARVFPQSILENLTLTDEVAEEALRELASSALRQALDARLDIKTETPILVVAMPDLKLSTVERLWKMQSKWTDQLRIVMTAPIDYNPKEPQSDAVMRLTALLQVGVSIGGNTWARAGALGPIIKDNNSENDWSASLDLALQVSRKFAPRRVPIIVCSDNEQADANGEEQDNIIQLPLPGSPSTKYFISGLFYKSDRSSWGGEGYLLRMKKLFSELCTDRLKQMVFQDGRDLLSWSFREPKAEQVQVRTFMCDFCQKRFPCNLDDEPFKKFDWLYCSTKCVSDHRKQNWKPLR